MDPRIISVVLLVGRLVAVFFLLGVVRIQLKLLQSKKYAYLQALRLTLLILTIIVLVGQVYPIVIDIFGALGKATPNMVILYAFSNNGSAMLTSIMLWVIYRLSGGRK